MDLFRPDREGARPAQDRLGEYRRKRTTRTPGGGLMPAYGKQITPAEMTILVDFLVSLRPQGQPPAGWATGPPSGSTAF